MAPIRTLIVDDEAKARQVLVALLERYCPGKMMISQADSVKTAVEKITLNPPELLFLDIRLKDGSGFDLLEKIGHLDFHVVFVSAYEEHAMQACRASAVDYLLKPVDPTELKEAVEKVERKLHKTKLAHRLDTLAQNLEQEKDPKRIVLKTVDSMYLISFTDIIYCRADGNYTLFHLADQREILVSKSLSGFEDILTPQKFIRTHQSYLVNSAHIASYEKGDGGILITTQGIRIPVSTRKKESVLLLLQNL